MTESQRPNPLAAARAKLGISALAMAGRIAERSGGSHTPRQQNVAHLEKDQRIPSPAYCLILAAVYETDPFVVLAHFGQIHPDLDRLLAHDPGAQRRALALLADDPPR